MSNSEENCGPVSVSIIFRALNESRWFGDALEACERQKAGGARVEIILVDSGSTDGTLDIAERHGCRILHIKKSDFTFGRSLNMGCDAANGDYLIFISAHCIPVDDQWLERLIAPLRTGEADYVYGGQHGHETSKFSEKQVFAHYFGEADQIPHDEIFCNNANSAIRRETWAKYRFDENVTGLEDMVLAKAIVRDGGKLGYVARAGVYHIHDETLNETRRRYYREALTMREIFPEVHFNFGDFARCFAAGVFHDFGEALEERRFFKEAPGVVAFRFAQFWGAYLGHNEHRALSRAQKESYYYPRGKRARRRKTGDQNEMAVGEPSANTRH